MLPALYAIALTAWLLLLAGLLAGTAAAGLRRGVFSTAPVLALWAPVT